MNESSGAAIQNGVDDASVLADLQRSQEALESAFQELEQTKEQLRLAIDSIPGMVWTALPDGRVEFLNARFLEYIGLKPDQVAGWGWHEAIHPEDLPHLMKTWGEVLASGKPGEAETRIKRFDGVYRWFLSRGVPLFDKQGKVIRWYGLDTDIQDRKQAEALLSGENRLLEMVARGDSLPLLLDALCQLVEAITSGALCSVLLVDSGGKQLVFGSAPSFPSNYTETIGGCAIGPSYSPCGLAAFLGRPVIASDIESETRWPDYRAVALAHGVRACWSTPILSREGKVLGSFAVNSREPGSPSPYQEGLIQQFTHIASIAIERTESEDALNQLQAELAHVARVTTLGELTASIAHEVNQPLAAVVTNADAALRWLTREPANLEETRAALERIIQDGNRASDVVARTRSLLVKKQASGVLLRINEVVQDVIALSEGEVRRHAVSPRLELAVGLPAVHGDRVQLQQVILNLIMNGIEAMSEVKDRARELSISSRPHEAGVLVAVRDSGPGIAPEHLDRIFEAFFTTKPRGLGMGLAISRSIVEAHRGRLWASPEPDGGCSFRFTLPAAEAGLP